MLIFFFTSRFTSNFLIPAIFQVIVLFSFLNCYSELPLFYWQENKQINFGDHLSIKLVERIVNGPVRNCGKHPLKNEKQLLAIGSILFFANNNDVIWGSGTNGKRPNKKDYRFVDLDVRAVRGPLTRDFLFENFGISSPEIYGDPALLVPYFFPEFQKQECPTYEYIVIPHYSEEKLFPKVLGDHVVYPTEPWDQVIQKICNSAFVISSSLHGVIIAEAFGIPARYLRITENEPFIKYQDYYYGTNRPSFQFASSVEEALLMGGEAPFDCDLKMLYEAFPFEFWPNNVFNHPNFFKD